MPPKAKHTRDEVMRAAVRVVEQAGLGSLTARSVAAALGTSTAPVYSQFATMGELARAAIEQIQRDLIAYTRRPYTDRVFLNMGTGVALFAAEHPRLYRALLLEGNTFADVVREFLETLEAELVKDARFTSLSRQERHALLTKMWTFTHGMAALICAGLVKDTGEEQIKKALVDIGTDVIGATLAKHQAAAVQPRPKERRTK